MTDTLHADALLTALISGTPRIEAFAELTEGHEREKALHVLLALLTDPDQWLRVRATRALGTLGDRRAVEPLINSLEMYNLGDDFDRELVEAQFEALVVFGDPAAIWPLAQNFGGLSMISLRERLLTAFDTRDLLRVFGDATDLENGLREMAFEYLGQIEDPQSTQLLLKALDDEDKTIRIKAACILNSRGVIDAVAFLEPYTSDPGNWTREFTARRLGTLSDRRAIPMLRPLLDDQRPMVRIQAALSLAALGDRLGTALTRAYLVAGPTSIIYRCLRGTLKALSVIHERLVPLVIEATRIPFERPKARDVAARVAESLAEDGAPSALEVLHKMLESDDQLVCRASQRAIDDLARWQSDKERGE
jgi:HEAT repeat protein